MSIGQHSPRECLRPQALVGVLLASVVVFPAAAVAETTGPIWPAPPAEPRIEFVKSIAEPEDLGIKKGFFRRFGEFFTGSEHRQLVRPMSVLEYKRVIYVGDPGARAVHRFDLRRQRYQLIQRADREPLPSPVGLAHDRSGSVYITDSILGKIFVLKQGAKYVEPMVLDTPLKQPTGIAINQQNGDLYISDTSAHQVKVFSHAGKLRQTIGQRGDSASGFNYPTMLWKNAAGELLVTDSLNFRVQTFDTDGRYVRSFGKLGNATGYFSRPKGVAADIDGNIYVVDSLFHALQIFNQEGSLLLSIGKQGNAAGEFWLPTGIYIAEDRKIYIADSHNRRIQVFRPVGGGAS